MMESEKTVIVLDDSLPSRKSTKLTIEGVDIVVHYRSPSHYLSEEQPLSGILFLCAVTSSIEEKSIIQVIKDLSGDVPIFLSPGYPPPDRIGEWARLSLREGNGDGEAPDTVVSRLMEESLSYYRLASAYQQCLKITTSYDREQILTGTLDAFLNDLMVESCVVWLSDRTDKDLFTLAAVRGLINIDLEGSLFTLSKMDFYEKIASGGPFLFPEGEGGYLYFPLFLADEIIGLIKAGRKMSGEPYSAEDKKIGKVFSHYCAHGLKTLIRITKLENATLIDPETKVYSSNFFHDYFEKEAAKSLRFERPLSIVYLDIENLPHLSRELKETLVHEKMSEVLGVATKTLRDSDVISRMRSDRFCILLPETDFMGALITMKRLRDAFTQVRRIEYLGDTFEFSILMRAVSYPDDGADLPALTKRAEGRFTQLRRSSVYRYHLYEKHFWDIFEILLGQEKNGGNGRRSGENGPYRKIRSDRGKNSYFTISPDEIMKIIEVISQDISLDQESRGILIVAGPRPELVKQIISIFELEKGSRKKIYILGRQAAPKSDSKNIFMIRENDEKLDERHIILYLKEEGSFALLGRSEEGMVFGLNSCDDPLIEILYEKIQKLYMLQATV